MAKKRKNKQMNESKETFHKNISLHNFAGATILVDQLHLNCANFGEYYYAVPNAAYGDDVTLSTSKI